MDIFSFVSAAGGLALFLYGMHMLSDALEKVSGNKLAKILEKLTGSPARSVLLGAIITAIVQSSGATTVIAVGLVNSGILRLSQAIGIIMGSNIGTTVTGQILRLTDVSGDSLILKLLQPSTFAPVFALVGAALVMFSKKTGAKTIGEVLTALGILFMGMLSMEGSLSGLKDSPVLSNAFATIGDNAILGIAIGAAVTALLQSSSASVGILQALSSTGAITWVAAVPIILGQNIGSTVTSMISSIGASKNAKRTSLSHLYFNVIGTIIFGVGMFAIRNTGLITFWDEAIDKAGIANFHTIFNISMTLILLPFINVLEKICIKTIPEDGETIDSDTSALDERLFTMPAIAIEQSKIVMDKIANASRKSLSEAMQRLSHPDTTPHAKILEKYSAVAKMNDALHDYLVRIDGTNEWENRRISELLEISDDYLHIAEHAKYISKTAEDVTERGKNITRKGKEELAILSEAILSLTDITVAATDEYYPTAYEDIEPLRRIIGEMTDVIRTHHVQRLRQNECSYTAGTLFCGTLIDIERVAKHCANISVCLAESEKPEDESEHDFIARVHKGDTDLYNVKLSVYEKAYYNPLLY